MGDPRCISTFQEDFLLSYEVCHLLPKEDPCGQSDKTEPCLSNEDSAERKIPHCSKHQKPDSQWGESVSKTHKLNAEESWFWSKASSYGSGFSTVKLSICPLDMERWLGYPLTVMQAWHSALCICAQGCRARARLFSRVSKGPEIKI